jgi:hypothetical protein
MMSAGYRALARILDSARARDLTCTLDSASPSAGQRQRGAGRVLPLARRLLVAAAPAASGG